MPYAAHDPCASGRWRRLRRRVLVTGLPRSVLLRRVLAVLLFALAGGLALVPGEAEPEPSAPVLITADDLEAGQLLARADVRVAQVPERVAPAGALDSPDDATGRVLTSAARAGEPLTDARLVGRSGGTLAGRPGTVAVPLRLPDGAITDLLHPGATVDVVALDTAEQAGEAIAQDATVLTITSGEQEPTGPVATPGASGPLVLLALDEDIAPDVAAVSLQHPITVTLR
ncbi:SAF domain-containing protein [Haloechinothrix sp. LS1_15]|uniref:SAF domain-containing protein n=1 Tax=Haloechinothrix sp. LS1_15 TaxID=2652248 RepID=UPI0029456878|nr:SAF domain-containing protein [Haloechinothrix sp. LS1_15]MDV6014302.1 hypothetical protein [Haloechinothrix sp. LS1_15]